MDTLCPLPSLPSLPPRSHLPVTPVALLSMGKASRPFSRALCRGWRLPVGPSCPRAWWWLVGLSSRRHGRIPDLHLNRGFVPSQTCSASGGLEKKKKKRKLSRKALWISTARGLGSVFSIGCQGEEWDGEVLRDEPLLLCICGS